MKMGKKGTGNYIPPGSYTLETLPPLSEEAKNILRRVKKDAEKDAAESKKKSRGKDKVVGLNVEPLPRDILQIRPTEETRKGINITDDDED